jgi:uncharacterized membrane protein
MRLFLCSIFALSACTSPQPTGIANLTCSASTTLTYTNFGQAFIKNNCLSCHENKDQPTLTTQNAIKTHAAKILDQAVYTDAMPQNGGMALADRQMLGDWLACGAP